MTTTCTSPRHPNSHSQATGFAKLPRAPITGSPVPHLTSLYHRRERGPYGDRRYPGNCSGYLISDLITFFGARSVFDPMTGSGTCRDVCQELGVRCWSGDIHAGFDLCNPEGIQETPGLDRSAPFDFVWLHPPYWRMKLYSTDPRDLSRSPTLEHFLKRYAVAIRNATSVLKTGGQIAILMGDYTDRSAGFTPLTWHTKRIAFECGLTQKHTDIVRFVHGASSSRKSYRSSFIPALHDLCLVFQKSGRTRHPSAETPSTALTKDRPVQCLDAAR